MKKNLKSVLVGKNLLWFVGITAVVVIAISATFYSGNINKLLTGDIGGGGSYGTQVEFNVIQPGEGQWAINSTENALIDFSMEVSGDSNITLDRIGFIVSAMHTQNNVCRYPGDSGPKCLVDATGNHNFDNFNLIDTSNGTIVASGSLNNVDHISPLIFNNVGTYVPGVYNFQLIGDTSNNPDMLGTVISAGFMPYASYTSITNSSTGDAVTPVNTRVSYGSGYTIVETLAAVPTAEVTFSVNDTGEYDWNAGESDNILINFNVDVTGADVVLTKSGFLASTLYTMPKGTCHPTDNGPKCLRYNNIPNFTNIRLVDLDNNAVLAGPVSFNNNDNISPIIFTNDIPLSVGNHNLALLIDVINNPDVSGTIIHAGVMPHLPNYTEIQDTAGNPIVPSNNYVIYGARNTIVSGGVLMVYEEDSPDSSILIAGSNNNHVARYRLESSNEEIEIKKLTIINDIEGAFDTPADTYAPNSIYITYTDANGVVSQEAIGSPYGNTITFSGLDLYVPENESTYLDIYANINSISDVGEILSGQKLRLGLLENNTISTFEAVNMYNEHINQEIHNGEDVNTFIIRKSKLTFTKEGSSLLSNISDGTNTLYSVIVDADSNGVVGLARLVFDVEVSGLDGIGNDIVSWVLYRNSSPLSGNDVNVYCMTSSGVNETEIRWGSEGLEDCDGINSNGISDGNYKIIFTFNDEEVILGGSNNVYQLKANVIGADTGDSVTTSLANGDEFEELTGMMTNTTYNTGKIYSYNNATNAIFTDSHDNFSKLLGVNRNIIWSDQSADAHAYATISAGSVTTDTGSYDFTNGYLLNVPSSHTITAL